MCWVNRFVALACIVVLSAATTIGAASGTATISLSLHDEPVRSALLQWARSTGRTIAFVGEIQGTVTAEIRNASPDVALREICTAGNVECQKNASAVRVRALSTAAVSLSVARAEDVARAIAAAVPGLRASVRKASNGLVLQGSASEVQAARQLVTSLDVNNGSDAIADVVTVRSMDARSAAARLDGMLPNVHYRAVGPHSVAVIARTTDMASAKAVVAALEVTPMPSPPGAPAASEAVRISTRDPRDVVRGVARALPHRHVSVSGSSLVLTGPPDEVTPV